MYIAYNNFITHTKFVSLFYALSPSFILYIPVCNVLSIHCRHSKGKVLLLLENANVAVFKRFPGTILYDAGCHGDVCHLQMVSGTGIISTWCCCRRRRTCLSPQWHQSNTQFGVLWATLYMSYTHTISKARYRN